MSFKNIVSNIKKKENAKILKDIKKIVIILICSFLFLIIWANKIKLSPENVMLWIEGTISSFSASGSKFPTEIDGNSVNTENLQLLGNKLFAVSDISFSVLNKSGKEIRGEKHNMQDPILKTRGLRAILFDVGNKKYRIESVSKNLHKSSTDKNIVSCDIADDGSYAVLTESQNYLSELTAYNRQNTEKYKYCFSEHYICDISLNSAGNKCAACGISSENGIVNSTIYILDFKSEKPENTFKIENNIVNTIKHFSNGNILAIGDKCLSVINVRLGTIKSFSYDDKILKFYNFSGEYGLSCCFTPSNNKNNDDQIIIIDTFGKDVTNISTKENFKSISHSKNRIVALSRDKISIYSFEGRYEGYMESKNIFRKIILASDSKIYRLQEKTIDKAKIQNLRA